MAARTYKARGLVLRKAKLRESDAIITILDSDGERRDAVAHGARRPGSSLSGRMELYSEVDLVCAKGRNLDTITDSRLTPGSLHRFGMEQSLCAAPVAELLVSVSQAGLRQSRLYELARATFSAIADSKEEFAPAFAAAALLKICAIAGVRPTFGTCVLCGSPIEQSAATVPFSAEDGGAICSACPRPSDAVIHDAVNLAWAHQLLYSRYDAISELNVPINVSFTVLSIAGAWVHSHFGTRLKSLDVLMSCGLF